MTMTNNRKSECVRAILKTGVFKSEKVAASFLITSSLFVIIISGFFSLSFIVAYPRQSLATTYSSIDQTIFKIAKTATSTSIK